MKKTVYGFIILLIFLLPVLYIVYEALSSSFSLPFLNIPCSILVSLLSNTLLVSIIGIFFAFITGLGCAVAVVYYEFPGRSFFEAALCLPLAFPPYIVAAVYKEMTHQYYQFGAGIENIWGAGLIFGFTLYPYFYLLLKTTFQNQSVIYIETGKSLGLHYRQRLFKIIFPMAKPAMFLGLLLVIMEIISDYGTVQILGVRTITAGIYDTWFSMFNQHLAAQLSLVAYVIPLLFLFIWTLFSRNASFYNPPNRWTPVKKNTLAAGQAILSVCLLSIPLLAGFIIPFSILVSWAIEKLKITNTAFLFSNLFNTVILAFIVTLASIIISMFLHYLKRNSRPHSFIHAVCWIICAQYAVPGIVIGIALLFLTSAFYTFPGTRWLVSSIFLIVFACIIRYLCFSFFSIESGMKRISSRLDELTRILRKKSIYRIMHIHLPLLKPSIMIGCIFTFIIVAKELTMSLVLQPFHYSSLSLRIFSYTRIGMIKNSALFAIVLVLLSIYPVFSLSRWFNVQESIS
ncbi:MAG: iron ABC transporter permease [Spirochaetales bacterium]|nr:iron ABC transporter permease [Spirochaetales bacterium]